MKRYWASFGILTAVILSVSSPLLAHDECDDVPQHKLTCAESHESMASQSEPESKVMIKLFQYQPGRVQARVWDHGDMAE